ncbi:hypothetical protein Tcan_13729 [Toxocara canis]|uniref:Methyltransferase-like protein 13 n=1 Tax=Toxocara canis TaxID=6265 RepID=A0A0B2UTR3_TOXCA|nr:hypothetical protein Tcan_13729 [Toxocara canis]
MFIRRMASFAAPQNVFHFKRNSELLRLTFTSVVCKKKVLISALIIMVSLFIARVTVNDFKEATIVARICPKTFHCLLIKEDRTDSGSILRSLISEVHPDFMLAQVFITHQRGWLDMLWRNHYNKIIGSKLTAHYQHAIVAAAFLTGATTGMNVCDANGRMLFAGVGARPLAHFIHTRCNSIEINELILRNEIWNLTRHWLGPFSWPIVDGTEFDGVYDVILFDQCSNYVCPSIALLPTAASLQRALKDGGVFITNINAPTKRLIRRNFKRVNRTLSAVYNACLSIDVHYHTEPNKVFVCGKGFENTIHLKKTMKKNAKFVFKYLNLSVVSFH